MCYCEFMNFPGSFSTTDKEIRIFLCAWISPWVFLQPTKKMWIFLWVRLFSCAFFQNRQENTNFPVQSKKPSRKMDTHREKTVSSSASSLGTRHTAALTPQHTHAPHTTVPMEIQGPAMLNPRIGCLHTPSASRPSYARFPSTVILIVVSSSMYIIE